MLFVLFVAIENNALINLHAYYIRWHTPHVVQVGGIKEKVLAAHRAGIKHVILPQRNEKDLKELPQAVKVRLVFSLSLVVLDDM